MDINPGINWKVKNKIYHRKTDALLASAESNNAKITFNYYNDAFSQCDWSVEPTESFEELAILRAHQLRDCNKYIRLWYSGGADSHTMLLAFLDSNIYIDEIVVVRTSPVDDFNANTNQESNLRSIPYLRSIQHTIPKTKISIVDMTAAQYLEYYKQDDWLRHTPNYDFSDDPGLLLGSQLALEKYAHLLMNDDIVEITGGDKPKTIKKNGIYYTALVDSQFQYMYWVNNKEFFTTPEFPQLHSKQCHMLKHILERRYPESEDISHIIYNPETIDQDFKKEWYHCCRQIINYEIDLGKSWTLNSPKNMVRASIAKLENPELLKHYVGSLKELQPKIKHYWKNFDDLIDGVIANVYCLGK